MLMRLEHNVPTRLNTRYTHYNRFTNVFVMHFTLLML